MKNTKLQNPSLRKRKGFTLIELIVVIAILAILAAIAIPTFLGQVNKAKYRTHNANVMTLRSSAAVAVAQNGAPAGGDIVWSATTSGTGEWAAASFIDTWPENPLPTGNAQAGAYTVTIQDGTGTGETAGAIVVNRAKVNADTGAAVS